MSAPLMGAGLKGYVEENQIHCYSSAYVSAYGDYRV